MNYSVIKIPETINNLLDGLPPVISKPEKPTPPVKETIYPPEPPKEIDGFSGFVKRLFFYIIGCGIVILMAISDVEFLMGLGIFFGLFTFPGLFWTIFGADKNDFKSKYDKTQIEYQNELQSYKIKKAKIESEYNEKLKIYNGREMIKFHESIKEYDNYMNNFRTEEFIHNYKWNQLKALISEQQRAVKINKTVNYNKGVS